MSTTDVNNTWESTVQQHIQIQALKERMLAIDLIERYTPSLCHELRELKETNKKLEDAILNLRGLIYEKNPQYFDEWVGEFVHSPLICLERIYQFLEENL